MTGCFEVDMLKTVMDGLVSYDARMMGRLDPVVLSPRGLKSVVHGDLLVIDTIEIGPERMECASEEVSDLIERQGKIKEYLDRLLNALARVC
jgi:hypothetical protein